MGGEINFKQNYNPPQMEPALLFTEFPPQKLNRNVSLTFTGFPLFVKTNLCVFCVICMK